MSIKHYTYLFVYFLADVLRMLLMTLERFALPSCASDVIYSQSRDSAYQTLFQTLRELWKYLSCKIM